VTADEAREQAWMAYVSIFEFGPTKSPRQNFLAGYSARDPEVAALKAVIEKVNHEQISLAVHRAMFPELMSISRAIGSQKHYDEMLSRIADEVLTLLASVPSSVPSKKEPTVDELANFIRTADGNNRLGAGELAEKIIGYTNGADK
jgi:hypothetical protein